MSRISGFIVLESSTVCASSHPHSHHPLLPPHLPSSTPSQSVFTFLYITLLSHMGERLAVRLRTAFFRSLVEQDMVFFDSHKSGELVSR